jgi:hypothetical protein
LAVYRNDQVDFSFGAEIGAGGYLAPVKATADSDGDLTTTTDTVSLPGARTIGVTGTSDAVVGEYIQIGTFQTDGVEIRQIKSFVADDTITLTAPIGYYHRSGVVVQTVDTTTSAGTMTGLALDTNTSDHMRFTPGAWESIEVPDPTMEIEPRYFLGVGAKRNYYSAYKGQQSLSGTLSNFELLNGYPLRFPIGTVSTAGTDKGSGGGSPVDGIIYPGQYEFDVDSGAGTGYAPGDYIAVGKSLATCEVRKIVAVNTNNIWVDYPFLFEHAADEVTDEVTAPYTHTITEAVELPGISWQVNNKDSSEAATNDWIRRYYGGKIGQATLTAEEGGTLRMSWESAPFMNMDHNQYDDTVNVGVNKFDATSLAVTVERPSTEPYYFSQGSISMFGVEFARVANFTININNNLEPRYFISSTAERTPSAIFEGRREYSMTATIVLPDSLASTATTRTLFKELLAEGDYAAGFTGFDIDLVFTRGANDTLTITVPSDGTSAAGGNEQGAFIRSANTSVSTENPASTEVDILFRDLSIVVKDSEPVYP